MAKYKFERSSGRELSIDKLIFATNNLALSCARDMLREDLNLSEIIITQIDPVDVYRVIITRGE